MDAVSLPFPVSDVERLQTLDTVPYSGLRRVVWLASVLECVL